jgi:hypothetical protein
MITKQDIENYSKFFEIGQRLVERANEMFEYIKSQGNSYDLLFFGNNSKAYQIKGIYDDGKIDILYEDTGGGDNSIITFNVSWFLDDEVFKDWFKQWKEENDKKKEKEKERLRVTKEIEEYNQYIELKEKFEENGVNGFKPFDVVLYKPKNEEGIVKSITENGVFVLFRIQSTAALCKPEDLEKL